MSDSKTADIKEMAEKAGDLAKNIWLAGLGAYGKAADEAQGTYQKVSEKVGKVKAASENSHFFEDLVEKGKKLEGETQEKFSGIREKAHATLEERLAKVKQSLSFDFKKTSGKQESADLLDEISSKLDLVLAALADKAATKAPVKKTATRKTAASKTA